MFELDGRRVKLIDTPGFDDSDRSDAEIFNQIAEFLSSMSVYYLRSCLYTSDN